MNDLLRWNVMHQIKIGRAQFICSDLLSRTPPPDVDRLARERLRAIEEALALQRGAA